MIERATAEHYVWGGDCDAWHLVKAEGLSVIQERMPPGSSEERHYHERARQFFFVLAGVATMELNGIAEQLHAGQGLEVAPGVRHRVTNAGGGALEFLVVSAPPSHGDRVSAK